MFFDDLERDCFGPIFGERKAMIPQDIIPPGILPGGPEGVIPPGKIPGGMGNQGGFGYVW